MFLLTWPSFQDIQRIETFEASGFWCNILRWECRLCLTLQAFGIENCLAAKSFKQQGSICWLQDFTSMVTNHSKNVVVDTCVCVCVVSCHVSGCCYAKDVQSCWWQCEAQLYETCKTCNIRVSSSIILRNNLIWFFKNIDNIQSRSSSLLHPSWIQCERIEYIKP